MKTSKLKLNLVKYILAQYANFTNNHRLNSSPKFLLNACVNNIEHFLFFSQGQHGTIDFKAIKPDWEDYCNSMAKSGEWADHIVIIATAHLLQRDIVIVTSSPQGMDSAEPFIRISCKSELFREPILLGHVWESHYQSLQRTGMLVVW